MDHQGTGNPATDVSTETVSNRPSVRPIYPERGGIDVFDSLLFRQPIANRQTEAVRELLANWGGDSADGDVHTLLPVNGVTLVTLFLDDGGFGWTDNAEHNPQRSDALLWYIKVVDDDIEAWTTPDATIRTASPLFERGLTDLLTSEATIHADSYSAHRYVTHVTNPLRQSRYADAVGRSLVAPIAGDELPIPVTITSLALKPGLTSTLVARAVDFVNWLKQFDAVQS